MKIAVLSGKGGTGKTFISVNLAVAAKNAVYIDCDVEEPNGRIFLRSDKTEKKEVTVPVPSVNAEKCVGCRKCVSFCRFGALAFLKNRPKLYKDMCHSCGGCAIVCEYGAIEEREISVGSVETGVSNGVLAVTGEMRTGEHSGIPVIREALKTGLLASAPLTVIDCPPGSACSVTESVSEADICIIVTEPTAFGLHNFKMVRELVKIMNKPCYAVINKCGIEYPKLEDYCIGEGIPVLMRIPYDKSIASALCDGRIAALENEDLMQKLRAALTVLGGEV